MTNHNNNMKRRNSRLGNNMQNANPALQPEVDPSEIEFGGRPAQHLKNWLFTTIE